MRTFKKILILLMMIHLSGPFALAEESYKTSGAVTVGYDSRYVLYGYTLSRHLYRSDLYLRRQLTERVSVWGGAWYGSLNDGTYNELDLYGGADYQISEQFSTGVAYSIFNYIEAPFTDRKEAHEFAGHVTWASGPFSLSLRNQYDNLAQGHLTRGIATFNQPITDALSFVFTTEYGYAFEYYSEEQGGQYASFRITLPYQLNESWSVAPFVAHSIPMENIDEFENEEFYGGVSLSYAF